MQSPLELLHCFHWISTSCCCLCCCCLCCCCLDVVVVIGQLSAGLVCFDCALISACHSLSKHKRKPNNFIAHPTKQSVINVSNGDKVDIRPKWVSSPKMHKYLCLHNFNTSFDFNRRRRLCLFERQHLQQILRLQNPTRNEIETAYESRKLRAPDSGRHCVWVMRNYNICI